MRLVSAVVIVVLVGCAAPRSSVDPGARAKAAYVDALVTGVDYEMVDRDGRVVASATDDRIDVGGVVARVDGDQLTIDGVTVHLPGGRDDVTTSLAPLLRAARYEGNIVVLDGEPPARAWLTADNKLDRLEVELSDGFRLVVTRQAGA